MNSNSIFMMVLFILGMVLVFSSLKISADIKNTCASNALRNSNRGILIIGVVFVVSSASFLLCHTRCTCTGGVNATANHYTIFSLVLGIILIILGATINAEAKGECEGAKGQTSLILTIGIIATIMSLGFLGYRGYEVYKTEQLPKFSF